MTRRRDIRRARLHNPKHAHIDLPPEDEPDHDDHDGYAPIRERDTLPMREGPPLDLRAPWQFPTN